MLRRLVAALLFPSAAFAGQVTYTVTATSPMVVQGQGHLVATTTVQIPKFDPQLGRLTQVQKRGTGQFLGTIQIENLDSAPYYCDSGLVATFGLWYVSGDWAWGLPAFDGTLDYGGASGRVLNIQDYIYSPVCLSNYPGSLTPCPGQFIDVTHSPYLADSFTGTGTFDQVDNASLHAHITGEPCSTTPGPVNLSVNYALNVVATWTVTYVFEETPSRFCYFEDYPPSSGPTCPCTPSSAGCPNSQNPQGADLIPSGVASLGGDTLVLTASGMGANTSCLFFQGSSSTYWGVAFGDGRRCATGVIRRLSTKQAIGGAASYPGTQDQPIHVRGQIAQPGTFSAYQVWYRDASPTFCTPATFNLTSAVSTVWTP